MLQKAYLVADRPRTHVTHGTIWLSNTPGRGVAALSHELTGSVRTDLAEADVKFGHWHAFGLMVLSSAWFAGTHRLVQAVVASCDASASVLAFALATIFAGWLCFNVSGLLAVMFVIGLRQRLPMLLTGSVVALWVLGISWAYIAVATRTLTDPVLMSVGCPGGTPSWWPSWVPLP